MESDWEEVNPDSDSDFEVVECISTAPCHLSTSTNNSLKKTPSDVEKRTSTGTTQSNVTKNSDSATYLFNKVYILTETFGLWPYEAPDDCRLNVVLANDPHKFYDATQKTHAEEFCKSINQLIEKGENDKYQPPKPEDIASEGIKDATDIALEITDRTIKGHFEKSVSWVNSKYNEWLIKNPTDDYFELEPSSLEPSDIKDKALQACYDASTDLDLARKRSSKQLEGYTLGHQETDESITKAFRDPLYYLLNSLNEPARCRSGERDQRYYRDRLKKIDSAIDEAKRQCLDEYITERKEDALGAEKRKAVRENWLRKLESEKSGQA